MLITGDLLGSKGYNLFIIIDYIVVYELVHLIYQEHTDGFWNQVDSIYLNTNIALISSEKMAQA